MPRGGARIGAGRKPRPKQDAAGLALGAEVVKGYTAPSGKRAAQAPEAWPFGTVEVKPDEPLPPATPPDDGIDPATGRAFDPDIDPLEFLKRVVRNPKVDIRTRTQAATQAAPYLYPKKDGKKPDAVPKGPSKFGTSKAPLSVVGGSKA